MAFISIGRIDKKLLFVFAIVIIQLINSLVVSKVPDKTNFYIDNFIENISSVLIGTILYLKYNKKGKKNNNKKDKRSFKHIAYLFLFLAIKIIYDRLFLYFNEKDEFEYGYIINTINGVEIILMTFGASLLLKYKYYNNLIINLKKKLFF